MFKVKSIKNETENKFADKKAYFSHSPILVRHSEMEAVQFKDSQLEDVRVSAIKQQPLQKDSVNPVPPPPENQNLFNGWGITVHHIISREMLMQAYNLLDDAGKKKVVQAAKDILSTDVDDLQRLEWPQGNLFYGPYREIRAEQSGNSSEMDTDAQYVLSESHYSKLKELNDSIKENIWIVSRNNTEKNRRKLKEILIAFYTYTRGLPAQSVGAHDWVELTTKEQIDRWLEKRPHALEKCYIVIKNLELRQEVTTDQIQVLQAYDQIKFDGGHYYYSSSSGWREIGCVSKPNGCYVRLNNKSGVIEYLESIGGLSYSTWVPARLAPRG